MNPVKYVQEVWSELHRVTWPSRKQTLEMTAVVIIVSATVGIYIAGLDALFTRATEFLLK